MEKSVIEPYEATAKVIAYTQADPSFMDIDHDEIISYVARVSNPGNQMNFETAPRLLNYLMRNSHWSPLEMVSITMEVGTTRDIGRQFLRHRSFVFQEFSQRYADPTNPESNLGFVIREARLQDSKNRQNSIEVDNPELYERWVDYQKKIVAMAEEAYSWAIDNGIAMEQARVVLPEGLTKSRLYVSGTLRSWIHYIALREANGTQKEHRMIADACRAEIFRLYPFVEEAWKLNQGS